MLDCLVVRYYNAVLLLLNAVISSKDGLVRQQFPGSVLTRDTSCMMTFYLQNVERLKKGTNVEFTSLTTPMYSTDFDMRSRSLSNLVCFVRDELSVCSF